MKRKCINFDDHFATYMSEWVTAHQHEYKNYDEMEDDMPQVYMAFLNTPAKWLDNVTPGAYFSQFEDAKDLVDWLKEYCDKQIPVPDLLLDQIEFVGKPCEKRLVELLKDPEATDDARMTAVGLLREMKSTLPKMLYIDWQVNRVQEDELKDNALESLTDMGQVVVQEILQVLPKANNWGREAFLEVLANYPGPEAVYRLGIDLFNENPDRQALFAGYLAKIGDDRALPDLIRAAEDDKCSYLTYIELRNAIEMLGGECPDREYEDDPEYDALRGLDAN